MKLAVVADSHDRQDKILKAVSIMNQKKIDALIHLGDYISPFVKKWFDELNDSIKKNFYGVFGNNDGERIYLKQNLGQICKLTTNATELILELDGKKIFASHMLQQETIEALAKSGQFNIILSGHTHIIVNTKYKNGVIVLNPGELCGYLTGKATFAIIDLLKMEVEIIEL